jgi:hypothetical protein
VNDEPPNRNAFEEPPLRPPMKPWKKWLLRTTAFLVLSFGVYFAQGWWRQSNAQSRLDEARAYLDATDAGWRLREIQAARAKRFPPDDQNIAKLASKIKDDTPKEFDVFLIRADDPSPWLPTPEFNRLPDLEKLADARRTRTICKDVIERALMLGTLTDGGAIPPPVPNPINMSLEHTQRIRNTGALLGLNAAVLAADKDGDGAIASCRAGLNLVRGVGDEPTLISLLVRVAMGAVAAQAIERTLGYSEPKTGLAELQAELLREAHEPLLAVGFRGERAWIDAVFDHLRDDPTAINQLGGVINPLTYLGLISFRGRMLEDQLVMLKLETDYMEIARGPSHFWIDRMRGEMMEGMDGPFVRLLRPASEKLAFAVLRGTARLRSLAVGIACERFRQANGRWPKELAEIPKSILAEVPRDPYVDAPLIYRVLPDGIVIYSVGEDRTDDGGKLTYSNPKPGEDVGARLWSPEFRRAAPK